MALVKASTDGTKSNWEGIWLGEVMVTFIESIFKVTEQVRRAKGRI